MSAEYDKYLIDHKANLVKGFEWLRDNIPELSEHVLEKAKYNITYLHDASKSKEDEYKAYDAYFYGNNKSFAVMEAYRIAWLNHLHRNPHHWQYWILINDDPNEGEVVLDMPMEYIIEMVCDWWAFSWTKGNLTEIFEWYDEHKDHIKFSPLTRSMVENLLSDMKAKLEGEKND